MMCKIIFGHTTQMSAIAPNVLQQHIRSILHCRKTQNNKFYKNNVAVQYQNPTDKRILNNIANGSKGRMPYDWLYFDLVKNVSKEKTFHACQIPQKLAELLIKSCTQPGDIVLVQFGGSGSEIEICRKLGRQFISAEIDEKYYNMILDRLNNGVIDEKYKLKLRNKTLKYDIKNVRDNQLRAFERSSRFTAK